MRKRKQERLKKKDKALVIGDLKQYMVDRTNSWTANYSQTCLSDHLSIATTCL